MATEIERGRPGPATFDIPISTSNGESFFTGPYAWGRITFPATLTGVVFTMQTSEDNTNWVNAYDGGTIQTITPLVDTAVSERIPDGAWPAEYMRMVSDDTEAAARTFTLHLKA